MDARFERYVENLRTVRTLSQPKFSPDMKAKELLETIQSNAIKCFDYMKENNAILNELVFQRAPAELTSAEIASLQEFADKMFNYASSEDCGIAYKVYSLLLENARIRGDKPAIVRYLYGKAVSLHYLNVRGRDYAINPYGTQVRGLFQEGAGYIAEYESFDKTTKGYIMRCLGNSRMSMPRSTPEECTEYMKVFDKAMGIITDPYYHQLDPDLPWGKFEYAMHMDRETLLSYLRHHNDPVVAAKVMESAEAIYRDRVLYKGEEARLQNWRVSYLYKAACFHAGRCTAREVFEERLLDDSADDSDFGINKNLTAVSYLVAYEVKMPPADRREMACRTEEVMDRSLRYLNNVPQNQYSRVVSRAVRELVEMQAETGTARRSLLNYILVAHKPTYVHSMMVAGLTRMFVKQMLKKSPELFVGVMGCKTVEEVRRSRIEICELAYECGLYHDVGKSYVFMYIGNNYRRLLDEEFTCIQWHTVFGYELLCNVGGKDDLAPAALYHHTFYDGHGGYPKNYPPCPAFAETYAFCGEPMMVDVVAAEETEVLFLNMDVLIHTPHPDSEWQPILVQNLLNISLHKNLALSERIFCTAPKTVRGRLLLYLSNQAAKAGSKSFRIPFDRQGLADHLNLDRSALSKELGKMRDEGILETTKNEFTLHELPE